MTQLQQEQDGGPAYSIPLQGMMPMAQVPRTQGLGNSVPVPNCR